MNYELCIRLLKFGFPFKKANKNSTDFWGSSDTDGIVYEYPTLSELIDAVKIKEPVITLVYGDSFWKVVVTDKKDRNSQIIYEGKTPEEALARLYLNS